MKSAPGSANLIHIPAAEIRSCSGHTALRSHQQRRRITHSLYAVLLLALQASALAATFNIPPGDVAQLKAAINLTNTNGEDDVINLGGGSYGLVDRHEFSLDGLPVIQSDGGKSLTINGNNAMIARATNGPSYRILHVGPGAVVTLNAVRISNGQLNDVGDGAGILNEGARLTLVDCTISNNRASQQFSDRVFGGGIYNGGGVLELRRCTLSGNRVEALAGDPATRGGSGGAIYNNNGTVRVQLCTFHFNSTNRSGGAIENAASNTSTARLLVSNSTFSANQAPVGGAISARAAAGSSAPTTIGASILAGPAPQLPLGGGGITSAGYNLTDGDGAGVLIAIGDQINTDPQFQASPVQQSGLTETIPLAVTSPAIDRGRSDAIPELAVTTDQRGVPRPFDFPAASIAPGGDGSDIGAFEKAQPSFVVTTTADHNDGACTAADCTLREAIVAANAQPTSDVIGFAPGVVGTIQLTSTLPTISTPMEIAGPGADVLTVRRDTGGSYRLLFISNNATSPSTGPIVAISGLTLTNGSAFGGAIYNDFGRLQIARCAIVGNNGSNGAGIYNFLGTVSVADSAISNNAATQFGGAFFNNAAQGTAKMTLTNCTVSGNSATTRGGAFYNPGSTGPAQLTLRSCTVAGNSSASGGGIYNSGSEAVLTLQNTILSAGTGANIENNSGGIVTSQGHNLSSDAAGGDGTIAPGGFLNQAGDKRNTNPRLDPAGLQNNGGTTPTIALLSDSPAINGANTAAAPLLDQRGFVRSGAADIGAFDFGGVAPTPPPAPTPTPTATPTATPTPPAKLANIATRLRVETGDNVLIGGFIITGSQPKRLIVRAIGPSLPNVAAALGNPQLEIFRGEEPVAANDNWRDAPNQQEIVDSTAAPGNDLESAILTTLDPGAYTAIVSGVGGETGVGSVEAYDLDLNAASSFANISTRGFVQTGDNVMIGGLILVGNAPRKVILRALGPSLGIAGQLDDPLLELFDSQGNPLASNNNWKDTQQAEIESTGIPPGDDRDAAIVATLPPAPYTAIVRGVNNMTGVALIEAYAL